MLEQLVKRRRLQQHSGVHIMIIGDHKAAEVSCTEGNFRKRGSEGEKGYAL